MNTVNMTEVTEPGRSNEKWVYQQEAVMRMLGKYHKSLMLEDWPRTEHLPFICFVCFVYFCLSVLVCLLQLWVQKEEAETPVSSKVLCLVFGKKADGLGFLTNRIYSSAVQEPNQGPVECLNVFYMYFSQCLMWLRQAYNTVSLSRCTCLP